MDYNQVTHGIGPQGRGNQTPVAATPERHRVPAGNVLFRAMRGGGGCNFSTYYANGAQQYLRPRQQKTRDGYVVMKGEVIHFTSGMLLVSASDTEKIEFLRNSPYCKGSPNAKRVFFEEYNPEAEAHALRQARQAKLACQNAVMNMDAESLVVLNSRLGLGLKNDQPEFIRSHLFDVLDGRAGKANAQAAKIQKALLDPKGFEAEQSEKLAHVAIDKRVITLVRGVYHFGAMRLGVTAAEVAAVLQKDEAAALAIAELAGFNYVASESPEAKKGRRGKQTEIDQ